MRDSFPFTAVVGQSRLKLALLLTAISPKIGGVLLSGERGSAKSTLVRSLAELLPARPLVTLPLGATEEMVCGSLRLDQALQQGEISFKPGLLARAHGGLLYVDEVNLLPDHLVDLLLDAAASGTNVVERDGISHQHEAEFVIVGTMNPDEGELRPQLLDRFGLLAGVENEFSVAERQQIVERRLAFDRDAGQVIAAEADSMARLGHRLQSAIAILPDVKMPQVVSADIATRCDRANVEGMRADITLHRAAVAHAALEQRHTVTAKDVEAVAELVLAHRRQEVPQTESGAQSSGEGGSNNGDAGDKKSGSDSSIQGAWGAMPPQVVKSAAPIILAIDQKPVLRRPATSASPKIAGGRRTGPHASRKAIGSTAADADNAGPDWLRTLGDSDNIAARINHKPLGRLLYRRRRKRALELDVVLLDTSASTLRGGGLSNAKGAVRAISNDAYLHRRRLTLITFGNQQVNVLLHPQRAPKDIEPLLQQIGGGGGTPFARGMQCAANLIQKADAQAVLCHLFLLTDSRTGDTALQDLSLPAGISKTLVDLEAAPVRLGLGRKLANRLGADYLHLVNDSTIN